MTYPAYSSVEESGVDWIGQKPSHWQVMKLHHMARMKSGSSITSLELEEDGEYPVFGGNGVRGRFSEYTHNGSFVLIGRQGAECGNINYAHGKFWASEHAVVVTPDKELDYRWLGETLRAMNLNQYSQSAAQPGLSVEEIGRLKLPFPPQEEQKKIADFLDWKTSQIDALIAKKVELVEKLKEKRVGFITQAVTKGLEPSVPMRDSGVEWLGHVPTQWVMKKVRHCSELVTSGSRGWAQYYADSGDLFLRITNLDRDSINLLLDDIQRVDPPEGAEGARTHTKAGDLLVSITADLGSVAVVPSDLEPAYVSQHLALVRLDSPDVDPEWIAYSIFSNIGKYQLKLAGYGGTKVQLSLPDIKEVAFCHPPALEEQKKILEHIRSTVGRMDALIEAATRAITSLTEYRSAIISAATAGRIDVRQVTLGSSV